MNARENAGQDDCRFIIDAEYHSRFTHWDTRAWVRSKPRRTSSFDSDHWFFIPELVMCPESLDIEARESVIRTLAIYELYDYLTSTVWVETALVAEACNVVFRAVSISPSGPEICQDALKIYTDEAAHAEMCWGLVRAVADASGVPPISTAPPRFVDHIERLQFQHEAELGPLVMLFAAIASETITARALLDVPEDQRVHAAIREVINDHARDEQRHASFFRQVFRRVWPTLSNDHRRALAVVLPQIVVSQLAPDRLRLAQRLGHFPEDFQDPIERADELCARAEVEHQIRDAARPMLGLLESVDAFADAQFLDRFAAAGLIT